MKNLNNWDAEKQNVSNMVFITVKAEVVINVLKKQVHVVFVKKHFDEI